MFLVKTPSKMLLTLQYKVTEGGNSISNEVFFCMASILSLYNSKDNFSLIQHALVSTYLSVLKQDMRSPTR